MIPSIETHQEEKKETEDVPQEESSADLDNLLNLNSINGRKIHVCYINRNGDMLKCNCCL